MQETQIGSLGQEDPLEEAWQSTLVLLPESVHGVTELDTLKRLSGSSCP